MGLPTPLVKKPVKRFCFSITQLWLILSLIKSQSQTHYFEGMKINITLACSHSLIQFKLLNKRSARAIYDNMLCEEGVKKMAQMNKIKWSSIISSLNIKIESKVYCWNSEANIPLPMKNMGISPTFNIGAVWQLWSAHRSIHFSEVESSVYTFRCTLQAVSYTDVYRETLIFVENVSTATMVSLD